MKENLRLIFSDNLIRLSIGVSTVLIILQGIITFITFNSFPPLIPLLNSQPWGTGRLFTSAGVFLIVPIFIFVFFFNNILSAVFYKSNTLISRILSFNSLLFIALGVFAYVQIVLLVL